MFPRILERFRAGGAFKASDYVAAWHRLDAIRAEWHAATAAYDGVILPSVASAPANITRLMDDADYYICENLLALRNTRVGNLMGLCGISLPTGVPSAGVMILCPPMAEAKLLRLGAAAEQALTPL
jgi:aspartyl-tRNA(Asn)/glutamyl-tRNA(Gln) amidotransferase subunit A